MVCQNQRIVLAFFSYLVHSTTHEPIVQLIDNLDFYNHEANLKAYVVEYTTPFTDTQNAYGAKN